MLRQTYSIDYGVPLWMKFSHLIAFIFVFDCLCPSIESGNSNLVYTIIRKRNVFHQLANLPCDQASITKALAKRGRKTTPAPPTDDAVPTTMEGALPPVDAEPGTLKATLLATPGMRELLQ